MSWGEGPWGLTPWGGGSLELSGTSFEVLRAIAIRENVVRVFFSQAVYWSAWHDAGDASRANRYQITAIEGTVGIDGLPVRPVAVAFVERSVPPDVLALSVDVVVDRPFSPWGAQYLVEVGQIRSFSGNDLDPTKRTAIFDGLYRALPSALTDLQVANNDIANPQTLSALLDPMPITTDSRMLGTYQPDTTGDYARDEGVTSYRKRVIRRLTTRKGAFAHLPGYGVLYPMALKQLGKAGLREALAADAEDQVRAEPETVDVKVSIRQEGSLTRFIVRVKTKAGASLDLDVPFAPVE